MKGLIFLLQTLNSLKYFFNFHLIFQPALRFFDLMHQVHLSLIFKLQNTIDKLLLNLMPHDQKENQFHHLRYILQVHQFMLAASFELQILHLVQIFFNFEQVLLVIKVAFIDVGEEMRVDLEEQNWNESGCPQLVEGIYTVLFSYEQSLLVKPNQQVMVVLVVITHLLQSQPMPKYSLKPEMPSVNTYNINNQAESNDVDSLCIDNQVSIEEIEINMQFVIVINVMSIQQVDILSIFDYPGLLSQDSLCLSLVGLNTIIICFSKIRHSSHTFQSLTGKFDLGTFLTVQKLQYTVYGSHSQFFYICLDQICLYQCIHNVFYLKPIHNFQLDLISFCILASHFARKTNTVYDYGIFFHYLNSLNFSSQFGQHSITHSYFLLICNLHRLYQSCILFLTSFIGTYNGKINLISLNLPNHMHQPFLFMLFIINLIDQIHRFIMVGPLSFQISV